jgi:hypothetical protein
MTRAFYVLAVVVFLGQATGIAAFIAGAEYNQICPDEGLDSQCGPSCMCYTCSAHHRPLTLVEQIASPGPQFLRLVLLPPRRASASSASFEIFHVPKPPLA